MITFDVDDVGLSSELWSRKRSPAESILQHLGKGAAALGLEAAASNAETLIGARAPGRRRDFDEEEADHATAIHPFVGAIHSAYDRHYALELSPDDVWLCLAQGFGLHVNANAEALRHKFVRHEGRELIRVIRNEFVRGSSNNDWPGVFTEFSDQIAGYIGKQRDLVVANFSTTGPIERAASEVVLMSAMQKYFEYRLTTLCGIPKITLLGTTEDWQSVRTRAAVFGEYDLGWWVDVLLPILDEFVAASKGKVNRAFWKSIYKVEGGSGGPYISGWMPAFFPYFMTEEPSEDWRDDLPLIPVANHEWFKYYKRDPEIAKVTTDSFPKGLSIAPFIWEYRGAEIPMQFLGGFVGVSQNPDSRALRPAIGWAVREAPVSSPSS